MRKTTDQLVDVRLSKKDFTFPEGYQQAYDNVMSGLHMQTIQRMDANNPVEIEFFLDRNNESHLFLFQLHQPLPLSIIIQQLEKVGIIVNDKVSYRLTFKNEQIWFSDFIFSLDNKELKGINQLFKDLLIRIWHNEIENDRLNSLTITAQMPWNEIVILRSYLKYLQQIGTTYSQSFIEETLIEHAGLSSQLINYFKLKFNPKQKLNIASPKNEILSLEENIKNEINSISNLDQDFVLRSFLTLFTATVRTNYFQCVHNNDYEIIVLKFQLDKMENIAPFGPKIDTYVYSRQFEAIHRRSSLVARGGIRWSDRVDFGTEILGLMRTQTVKNSVIIPTGAKGGFLLKTNTKEKELRLQEGVNFYKKFIGALLSITDNRKDSKIIHPKNVVCYDGDDPYLVVAADKGTASFSDYANDISKQYNFWLSDAFASGGKTGYNHKEMGITAKGAWESVKRHFVDISLNYRTSPFTVVGIGDMSGDVFGNGLLLSKNIKLIAAFDHRDIFIDPDPDPIASWEERNRLFHLAGSSWQDYNPELLSAGGGVFNRQAKLIKLTPQIKKMLAIDHDQLPPNELIKTILKAPVDLFWNGGVGTFVKASYEDNFQAADNSNNLIRVDASDLRFRIVAEGGNLGFTQAARIQYAAKGGRINTDFIDNVGGVDCSDHEVNIKILLNSMVMENNLTLKERDELLRSMQDEVGNLVCKDARDQALAISLIEEHSKHHMQQYQDYIEYLEIVHGLNREANFLPDNEKLTQLKSSREPLLRPQIAILLAHTKLILKNEILKTTIADDPFLLLYLKKYFPSHLTKEPYLKALSSHLLKNEIIAAIIANDLVNKIGITYAHNLQQESNACLLSIIKTFIVVSNVFSLDQTQELIESVNYKMPIKEQYEIFSRQQNLIWNASHWFLHTEDISNIEQLCHRYRYAIEKLYPLIPELMVGETKNYMYRLIDRFANIGMSKAKATQIAVTRALYSALNIIYVSSHYHFNLESAAYTYFKVGEIFDLVWFRDTLFLETTGDYWDKIARDNLRNHFDDQQRFITKLILDTAQDQVENISVLIETWCNKNKDQLDEWHSLVTKIQAVTKLELSMFFVAVEELETITKAIAEQ